MIKCSIYAIGQEILEGSIIDTNSSYIAKKLVREGFIVREIKVLPDNISSIMDALEMGFKDNDFIITTGGLGPTFDDLTVDALSKFSGNELFLNEKILKELKEKMKSRGRDINDGHIKQVMLPKNSIVFNNIIGTAPGVGMEIGNKVIIALPGVPDEMKYIFDTEVIPYLGNKYKSSPLFTSDLYFINIGEAEVNRAIIENKIVDSIQTIINVSRGRIIVRLRSFDEKRVLDAEKILKKTLNKFYFGKDEDTLEEIFVKSLLSNNITISTAESCTGGLIGGLLTNVPGASSVYKGGVIVYSNEIKIKFLEISEELLQTKGAVSYEVAQQMAINVSKKFNTNMSIAATGIAGPSGGTREKPVGLVYIGVCLNRDCEVFKHIFSGSRKDIRERSANIALSHALDILKK
jgi:nicotinamide-nucleotide amidase